MELFIKHAKLHLNNTAIVSGGKEYTYHDLLTASSDLAKTLLGRQADLNEQRVAFMVDPGFDYVKVQWAIWQAGGIAVPLCLSHPLPSLQYTIKDSETSILIVSPEFEVILRPLADEKKIPLLVLHRIELNFIRELPVIHEQRRALILYTSGTTNLPKGVVTTHAALAAQITSLVKAWEWSSHDKIVCVLPLHHVHGIVNVVSCALWSGACCLFVAKFDPQTIFNSIINDQVTLFMAVPTIYFKLITYFEALNITDQQKISKALNALRLMVSGSAALPVTVLEKWQNISGHTLLERYGMTEIGMAISNPYKGERRPGFVGLPLPGVGVRLADENNNLVIDMNPGEIQVKGPTVFREYWKKPEETNKSFTKDGWFKTGDIAIVENGYYRILGRNSIDIIKSGGYKISALEIEEILRTHPIIKDCAVVGIDNEEWGELVVAAIVTEKNTAAEFDQINGWLRERLPSYRIPRKYIQLEELPRNTMGKVTKSDIKKLF